MSLLIHDDSPKRESIEESEAWAAIDLLKQVERGVKDKEGLRIINSAVCYLFVWYCIDLDVEVKP